MKGPLTVAISIVALAVAIWVYFFYQGMRLDAAGTSVVVALSAAAVFGVRWIWNWIAKAKKKDETDGTQT